MRRHQRTQTPEIFAKASLSPRETGCGLHIGRTDSLSLGADTPKRYTAAWYGACVGAAV